MELFVLVIVVVFIFLMNEAKKQQKEKDRNGSSGQPRYKRTVAQGRWVNPPPQQSAQFPNQRTAVYERDFSARMPSTQAPPTAQPVYTRQEMPIKASSQVLSSQQNPQTILQRAIQNTELVGNDDLHELQCGTKQDNPMMHTTKNKGDSTGIKAEDSLLGSVEDLMVKGYSGNLDFKRDFVGEAMDLLNSYQL